MDCIAEKYMSGGKYLFFCFDAGDELAALPIAERLYAEGIRLWYSGSGGAEEAAERLENCSVCLFLLSPGALEQHSFLNKITYALCNSKEILFVFSRECSLSAGLMLQLDAGRVLGRRDAELYARLLSNGPLRACSSGKRDVAALELWSRRRLMFEQLEREENETSPEPESESAAPEELFFSQGEEKPGEEGDGSETVWETRQNEDEQIVVRLSTREKFPLCGFMTVIGRFDRDAKEFPDAAIVNASSVSRRHAAIIKEGGVCFLTDLSSRFGTYVDGRRLEKGERCELTGGMEFSLAGERFAFFSGREEAERFLSPSEEPEIIETPEPEVVEPPEPEVIETPEPEAIEIPEPEVIETPEPEVVESPEPEIIETPEPEVVETPEPEVEEPSVSRLIRGPVFRQKEESAEEPGEDLIDEMTVRIKPGASTPEDAADMSAACPNSALILRPLRREAFLTDRIETVIGRRSERRPADIMFDGNGEISREHAVIYRYGSEYLVRDSGSLSGTFLDGRRLGKERAETIRNGSVLRLAREDMLFFCGPELAGLRESGRVCTLESVRTGEIRVLTGELFLDRRHPWRDGLLKQGTVSRDHAVIYPFAGGWHITDAGSTNGSFVNGERVESRPAGTRVAGRALRDGDVIGVYDLEFRFSEYVIKIIG